MVTVNCAYTQAINPAGAEPVLTREQIWKGLQIKIRQAEKFVPVITQTDVIEDKGDKVTREAHFKSLHGQPPKTVREVCKSYHPTKVDFHQPNGALITNTISDGPGMTDQELNMTYTFEWRYPDVESSKFEELFEEHRNGAKTAVSSSIEAMRRMAKAGELD